MDVAGNDQQNANVQINVLPRNEFIIRIQTNDRIVKLLVVNLLSWVNRTGWMFNTSNGVMSITFRNQQIMDDTLNVFRANAQIAGLIVANVQVERSARFLIAGIDLDLIPKEDNSSKLGLATILRRASDAQPGAIKIINLKLNFSTVAVFGESLINAFDNRHCISDKSTGLCFSAY